MALHAVYPESYSAQLDQKIASIQSLFISLKIPEIKVFESPSSHYRMRAEFKIWHENDAVSYAMYQPGEYKKPYVVEEFPVASRTICNLMPALLSALNSSEILKHKLFQVEFLTTLTGDSLVTLIYHSQLSPDWEIAARELQEQLSTSIIGRSRKRKHVLDKEHVLESMTVNGETFTYIQPEGAFTQPNGFVCEKMLNWAVDIAKPLEGDLLELYCGNGNFTLPLSRQFKRVLATEISKTSVNAAKENLSNNNCENIELVRMSSEDFSAAMDGVREFRRLKQVNLQDYQFSTVFVDPPRAGLDDHTIEVVRRFKYIMYVSCNPETLKLNLEKLSSTHRVTRFALFDQFPYTHHVECGLLLEKV